MIFVITGTELDRTQEKILEKGYAEIGGGKG
jgi:hypothetical protein